MTTSLPGSARAVLDSPALAHLVTLNPDGSPQVTVVWVGLDGDEIVAAHLPEHRKVRNIRNDSRVALSIETATRNAMGLNDTSSSMARPGLPRWSSNYFSASLTPTLVPGSASPHG